MARCTLSFTGEWVEGLQFRAVTRAKRWWWVSQAPLLNAPPYKFCTQTAKRKIRVDQVLSLHFTWRERLGAGCDMPCWVYSLPKIQESVQPCVRMSRARVPNPMLCSDENARLEPRCLSVAIRSMIKTIIIMCVSLNSAHGVSALQSSVLGGIIAGRDRTLFAGGDFMGPPCGRQWLRRPALNDVPSDGLSSTYSHDFLSLGPAGRHCNPACGS